MSWSQEEKEATDVKIMRLLMMHGGFHHESSTMRIRGLVSVKATIQDETTKIQKSIKKMSLSYERLRECLSQWKSSEREEEREEEPSWIVKPPDKLKKWLTLRSSTSS